ncbi:beta-mannosidase [Pinibacter soli]|uniref:Beta-mannosidase B n=1 Tax=Pinibacter soli TaxID=3044211 RepID=A0ABT6RH95_9BACT|nr:glycoside hydrolase family 2 protein [Pinibacter soli]MDI3321913.1 hypothetical protein [Pinibacter soli]
MKKILLAFSLLLITTVLFAQYTEQQLNTNWTFKNINQQQWLPATVPGTVHTDLLSNKKIEDPFYRDNEPKLRWIERENWEYKTTFPIDVATLQKQHILLQFDGLDTYADVYLNGKLFMSANNMFRVWKADAKNFLKASGNELIIKFRSAQNFVDSTENANYPLRLPENDRVYARKAQYHFGWDWGPKFTTCGIWRPVKIVSWNDVKVNNIQITTPEITAANAVVKAVINIQSDVAKTVNINASPYINNRSVTLQQGENNIELSFNIAKPVLWWSNGLGEPHLYSLAFTFSDGNKVFQQKNETFGVRTVHLIQKPDAAGKSFYIELNGVPVFLKGGNYIPQSPFLTAKKYDDYAKLINDAKTANFNALRVWGGGTYEEDMFYDLCDKNGILVWQDLMFACGMYPADEASLNNIKTELKENIERLRNHPSIALWCGNNENKEGWFNWFWQRDYKISATDSVKLYDWYQTIFEKTIPQIITQCDPQRDYWPTSPSYGWEHKESLTEGDSHYWGVWHGPAYDFEIFEEKTGRFVSEYGMQGFPTWNTIERFALPEDYDTTSNVMRVHQRNPPGYGKIKSYMSRYYKTPKNFYAIAYVSQVLQQYGIGKSTEIHRRKMPYCMGTFYWQLNDCWPVVSWSSIDGSGNWKALHYQLAKNYAPFLITVKDNNQPPSIYIVSDKLTETKAVLSYTVTDFSGKVLMPKKQQNVVVSKNSSKSYIDFSNKDFARIDTANAVMQIELKNGNEVLATQNYYFTRPKNLALPPVTIRVKMIDSTTLEVTADKLAKNVWLSVKAKNAHFSDNFFDLMPGTAKRITVSEAVTEREVQTYSLADSY